MQEVMGAENAVLEARGVTVRFSDARPAVDGVSLAVNEREIVALIGPNGAGKSTLLRAFSGAIRPSAGEVRLRGQPIERMSRGAVARELAVVAQAEEVALGFRVREVVMMGRAPHQGTWLRPSADDEAVVDHALARCDLTALAQRPADALSGGEKKRVQIARALAQRPKALLLDEPAASLDVRHALDLCDLLVEEVGAGSLACVMVMHDLNLAAQYADRVALMRDGQLVACGKVEEVMTYQALRDTFGTDLYAGLNEVNQTRFFLPMRVKPR
jgi:iron complex transport system ATP-binding protein